MIHEYKNHKHFPHLHQCLAAISHLLWWAKLMFIQEMYKINYAIYPTSPTYQLFWVSNLPTLTKSIQISTILCHSQPITKLTKTSIETIPLRMLSISASGTSLKQASQTPIILCKSSSIPFGDFSSEISAPRLLKYARSSWAYLQILNNNNNNNN